MKPIEALKTLRGTAPAVDRIMSAWSLHRGEPGASARTLEALAALEQQAHKANKDLMSDIAKRLAAARELVSGETKQTTD
ncbi:MAG: hypothetical protein HY326_08075 [Chloroflexi bacterium]|nr:hypothetical protein [Chloroflexota bacterium]